VKVYFVTHATTEDNEARIASGWNDSKLSEFGIWQARELGKEFKDIELALVCCSDLTRSVDTVRLAFNEKIPIITDKRLREINYGDYNGKPTEMIDKMRSNCIKEPFPDGESYNQAVSRIHDFFREMMNSYSGKSILVVGHRATRYGLETLVQKKTISDCLNTPFERQPYWEYHLKD